MQVTALEVAVRGETNTDFSTNAQHCGDRMPALPPGRESRDRQARSAAFDEWSRDRPVVALPPIPSEFRR
jgi:hypothetical protein